MKDIYKMKLHEGITISKYVGVTRVPGGWLYTKYLYNNNDCSMNTTFVPWHDSGRLIESNGNNEELKAKLQKAEDFLYRIQVNLGLNPPDLKTIKDILTEYGDK